MSEKKDLRKHPKYSELVKQMIKYVNDQSAIHGLIQGRQGTKYAIMRDCRIAFGEKFTEESIDSLEAVLDSALTEKYGVDF